MPLFKRRNAVKGKHTGNIPKHLPIKEDETSVISEVNSMLNELVSSVSDKADSALNIDGHMNRVSSNDVLKQTESVQENYECPCPVSANSVPQQKDSPSEIDKCSSSTSYISTSEHSSQENETSQSVVKENSAFKQADSILKIDDRADTAQANNVSEDTNFSQENGTFMSPVDVANEGNSTQKNVGNSVQMNAVSNKCQENDVHENTVKINDISNQINPTEIIDEDTIRLSTNNVSNEIKSAQERNEHTEHGTEDISCLAKQKMDDSNVTKSDSSKSEVAENVLTREKKIAMKETRSSSECGSSIESQTKYVRRKFGSEAEVLSICQKILPPEQQKGINEAVVKYIDNLIKESIFKAVKSINVDNLCEELMKDVSDRKNSQSTESEEDFVVEQRLSSNSISELVELQNVESKTNGSEKDSFLLECDVRVSDIESLKIETGDTDSASFGGYLADLEDTDDLKSAEEDSLYNSSSSGLELKFKSLNCNLESFEITTELESSEKTVDDEISETMAINEQTMIDESNSLCNSTSNDLQNKSKSHSCNSESSKNADELEYTEKTVDNKTSKTVALNDGQKVLECSQLNEIPCEKVQTPAQFECVDESEKCSLSDEKNTKLIPEKNIDDQQKQKHLSNEDSCADDKVLNSPENLHESGANISTSENAYKITNLQFLSPEDSQISLESMDDSLLMENDFKMEENKIKSQVKRGSLPNPNSAEEERLKINWRVGNLHVKLPHKSRGKTSLKAWKKRRVVIQPDEFANDPTNQSLVISVYGSKKHEATFWHSVSSQKAVVFRSSSHTHPYAFTISEGGQAIIHLSAENETETQEWMAAMRAVLWPPSPFMELEKMLSGQEFEVSIIDNEFSYHAGLLGMYGYLSITPKKLILLHPQQGYVIQEWYLNTVDKFQFVLQQKAEDMHKVLCMTTCKDSSTGQGDIIFFCKEAVTVLQSLASTIHQVLSYHSKQEGGKYQKELEELAEWMVAPPQDCLNVENDEHYKVPPRQVKSLLDIPNFIFNKSLSPVASAIYPAPNAEVMATLDTTKNKLTNTSQDSGISNCTTSDDFLNCSTASFVVGGGSMTGKSSDSELSDAYTPPRTPETKKKMSTEVVKKEPAAVKE